MHQLKILLAKQTGDTCFNLHVNFKTGRSWTIWIENSLMIFDGQVIIQIPNAFKAIFSFIFQGENDELIVS